QSYLQSGGFQTTSIDPDEVNYMIIGRFGTGRMFIKNGGQSYNLGPTTTLGTTEVFGAVIGSAFAAVDADPPPASGDGGSVYVDGDGSTWTVGGTLQVGGFHNNRTGSPPVVVDDLDGNEAVYLP